MILYASGTFTGAYKASSPEQLAGVDVVIGHEFGAPKSDAADSGAANFAIAAFIATNYPGMPIVVHQAVAQVLEENFGVMPKDTFEDTSSNHTGNEGGTHAELLEVIRIMGSDELTTLHVTHAFHAGRVAAQAQLLGLQPHLPEGLPRMFDRHSKQWWCRGRLRWAMRELVGQPALIWRGEL